MMISDPIIKSNRLSELKSGDISIITSVSGSGAFRKRITEMGFVKGKQVRVIKNAPLLDPVEYEIMGYNVSLRRTEAEMIKVVPVNEYLDAESAFEGTVEMPPQVPNNTPKGKVIKVALVGNPNCGKTTLFNYASGAKERVGNYSGVTIDAKEAHFKQDGYQFQIVDLPGTYSITEYTPEELYVRDYMTRNSPDIVINVVDASNLERNLYLTTQLIDMNIRVVMALNMFDELTKKGIKFDYESLGAMIGIPIVPTVGSKGKGIHDLFQKIIEVYEERNPIVRHVHVNYGTEIEKSIVEIEKELIKNSTNKTSDSPRYLSIKLLEDDTTTRNLIAGWEVGSEVLSVSNTQIKRLQQIFSEKPETTITDAKYGFIAGALKETLTPGPVFKRKKTEGIDRILTHKIWGFPIFMFFMWLMFQTTFTVGSFPMDWIDGGVTALSDLIAAMMPEGSLKDLLVDGIIGGVGGVIVFLPNIIILFFFISLMEDTGYMARASFIMDKLMHKIGLHGKSFIPMIMGFGCNVPAVMATRTLENRSDRTLTMLMIPFMSCSARLPVYVLLISAFFPKNQGLVLFSIYFIGVALAVGVGLLFKNIFFKKKEVPFVMELPPYRMPTLRNTSIHMWAKAVQYLKKMGGVILVASIGIWALGYYPQHVTYSQNFDQMIAQTLTDTTLTTADQELKVQELQIEKNSEHQANSYIGRLGHLIEPAIAPLGYDWKIGVSIITGLAAKEIVVSTMGVLYQAGNDVDETSETLLQRLQNQTYQQGDKAGEPVFSQLIAFSLMLFVLIYFPCVAVIAAIKKESNWKWAAFTMFYTTAIAYFVAWAVYQIGCLII